MTAAPEPFQIEVPDAVLSDLGERLARTRWPDQIEAYGWRQGAELGAVKRYAAYWADGYDWRAAEADLNRLSHFTAPAGGLRIHFVHERSPHEGATPLLIQHGWPGSFFEFHKIVEMLTRPERHGGEPEDAFHVVAPSLPGYVFSEAPREPGMHPGAVGEVMHESDARRRSATERYAVQGGDWGAVVASAIALAPSRVGRRPAPQHAGLPGKDEAAPPAPSTRRRRPGSARRARCSRRTWRTSPSRARARLRSVTASTTRRRACSDGSWRSSPPGPTATGSSRTRSPATSS